MCGLAGVYEARDAVSRSLLLAMAGELAHRGPDGTGLYLDERFGMVNTRLAIVDIAGGDQPIQNGDARLWVMQNGEIYNAPELRDELEHLGHVFETRSDTEVLVHAYDAWGHGCLARLNGEFAFAVWNRKDHELFLARDRFGIRPLFVAELGRTLVFASEAKAILRHPRASRSLDAASLVETLELWQTLPDRSAFTGVRELAPGSFLRFGPAGMIEESRWWDLRFDPKPPSADIAEEVRAKLTAATRLRLRADVPVGVYLSGGLDSSAIAALTRELTAAPFPAFSLHFEDALYDERRQQEQMARALDVELTSVEIRVRHIAEVFPEVIHAWEKPTLRTSPAPMLLLSRAVKASGCKVVLTGEGADEVFAGYDIFKEDKVRRFWARQPASTIRPRLLGGLHRYLARDLGRTAAAFYGRGLTAVDDPLYSHRLRFDAGAQALRLLSPELVARASAGSTARLEATLPAYFGDMTPLARAQYLETKTFMEGYLLHAQGDRMLMRSSVEGRFPFLDVDVAEHAAAIPDALRMMGLRDKHVLRKAVAPLLPAEIARRPKHPYRAPILRAFVGTERPDWVGDQLSSGAIARVGLFDVGVVTRLLERCERGLEQGVSERDEMALTFVLSTMLIHDLFVESPRLGTPAKATRVVVGNQIERPPE